MEYKSETNSRKSPRTLFKRPIRVKSTGAELFSGQLAKDISKGGVLVRSTEFVPVGTRMAVEVQLEDQGRMFSLEARVAWVKILPYSNGFQLGLEFLDGAEYEKAKIAFYVHKAW